MFAGYADYKLIDAMLSADKDNFFYNASGTALSGRNHSLWNSKSVSKDTHTEWYLYLALIALHAFYPTGSLQSELR